MNIFVGNLPFAITEDDLKALFEEHGSVDTVKLITDRETGRSRGFGFIEMEDSAAETAINTLNGTEMEGRSIRVNQAEERKGRR